MSRRVLFVDDEPQILVVYQRQVGRHFEVVTAGGGVEGMRALKEKGPFAAIVSDYRMPNVDGIQLLAAAKEMAPDTVRIMLTGFANMEVAVEAVNNGELFRFLTKPCKTEDLLGALRAAVEQYRQVTTDKKELEKERELLESTLHGGIKVMTDILSLVNPVAFSRASRIKPYVGQVARTLQLPNVYEFELAAMLSLIGCVILPPKVLEKIHEGMDLTPDEQRMYDDHPRIGARLIRTIPRMETVADIIEAQQRIFHPRLKNLALEDRSAVGGHIIKAALEYDLLLTQGLSEKVTLMRLRKAAFVPEVVAGLEHNDLVTQKGEVKTLSLVDLEVGMILFQDVFTKDETLLASKGDEVTFAVVQRLRNFHESVGVIEPVKVLIPATTGEVNDEK